MMRKQLELFSVDDMYGCIGIKDELYAVSVAAFLWAIIRPVSVLNEKLARKYYLIGFRGETKRISLPRELVVWENNKKE